MKSGIIFHGNNKSYRNFSDTSQIFQPLFVSCFLISMTVPLWLQILSFFTDLILLQKKMKYYRKAEQMNLVSKCCIKLMINILQDTRTKSTFVLKKFLLKITKVFKNQTTQK